MWCLFPRCAASWGCETMAPSAEPFVHWKRPAYRWFLLMGALIQLLCLWMNLRARETISRAGVLTLLCLAAGVDSFCKRNAHSVS
ncbi:hypothetical protein WMO24_15405 [Ruthenibacterium sp. CLA-JM-H11]|uniref:Uncharacterized protein n=2 Tax=Ruthenibacterium intestinale TaxID=3133163 RepID=A0ABV1GJV1_9FIRM